MEKAEVKETNLLWGGMVLLLAAVLSLTITNSAHAFCFEEAGQQYGINPQILRAIAKVESNFNASAVNKNTNGTYDIGLMQINSTWESSLGKTRWQAQGDACYNTKTGAWILSMCMNKYGYSWKAIGCYHSQTPDKRDRYSRKVFEQLQHVHPLRQEQAYTPVKEQLEGVVQEKVDGWVEQAVNGHEGKFTEKNAQYVPESKNGLHPPAVPESKPVLSVKTVSAPSLPGTRVSAEVELP